MTDRAPERIWLSRTANSFHAVWLRAKPRQSAFVEYVRADLAPSPPALSGEEAKSALVAMHREICALISKPRPPHLIDLDVLQRLSQVLLASMVQHDKAASLIERQAVTINISIVEIARLSRELAEARAALGNLEKENLDAFDLAEKLRRDLRERNDMHAMNIRRLEMQISSLIGDNANLLASRNLADGERR